jgi:DNA-binding response OmpR family regulator
MAPRPSIGAPDGLCGDIDGHADAEHGRAGCDAADSPDGGREQVPIIAMTANAFSEDKTRCFEAGMNDFLTKPFDPDAFFATLLRVLGRATPSFRPAFLRRAGWFGRQRIWHGAVWAIENNP